MLDELSCIWGLKRPMEGSPIHSEFLLPVGFDPGQNMSKNQCSLKVAASFLFLFVPGRCLALCQWRCACVCSRTYAQSLLEGVSQLRLGGDMGRLKFAFNNLLRLYVSKMKIHALKTWQTLFNRSGKFRLYLLCVSSSQEDSEQYTPGECVRIQGRVRRGSFQNFSVYQKGQGF